jgi:hypothetical protein
MLFVAIGSVDAGVDFSGLDERAVEVSDDRRSVCDRAAAGDAREPDLDLDRSYVYDRDRGAIDRIQSLFGDDPGVRAELYTAGRGEARDAARDGSGLARRAERNTRLMLEGLLAALGFTRSTCASPRSNEDGRTRPAAPFADRGLVPESSTLNCPAAGCASRMTTCAPGRSPRHRTNAAARRRARRAGRSRACADFESASGASSLFSAARTRVDGQPCGQRSGCRAHLDPLDHVVGERVAELVAMNVRLGRRCSPGNR